MCRRALNRAFPEVTVMETYRVCLIESKMTKFHCLILMQLFEWCHYMITSKKPQSPDVISGVGSKGTLDSSYTNQLSEHYKTCIPAYSSEYEEASKRATIMRKKNQFQDKSSWNPMGRDLISDERILLMGPSKEVIFYKSLSITDSTTKRVIQYSVQPSDMRQARCNSSFVFVKDTNEESSQPQYGSIVSLFTHTFTQTYYWAILDFFTPASYNTECSMWHVPAEPFLKRTVIPLDHLSYPLVVAYENEQSYNYSS